MDGGCGARMKNVVLLFVSFVLATSLFQDAESKRLTFEEIRETLQPVKKICMDRVSIDPKIVDEANKGNFVPDRKLQCYYKCMLVMTKAMTKDDKLIEKAFMRTVQIMLEEKYVEPVMKAIEHCRPIGMQPLEGCQLAYEIAKCYYDYDPTILYELFDWTGKI